MGGAYLSLSKLGGVNFSWSKLGGSKLTRTIWGFNLNKIQILKKNSKDFCAASIYFQIRLGFYSSWLYIFNTYILRSNLINLCSTCYPSRSKLLGIVDHLQVLFIFIVHQASSFVHHFLPLGWFGHLVFQNNVVRPTVGSFL